MIVWAVQGMSESGDRYLRLFKRDPTVDDLSTLVHSWDGVEDKTGPGYDGSYVHIDVDPLEVIDN